MVSGKKITMVGIFSLVGIIIIITGIHLATLNPCDFTQREILIEGECVAPSHTDFVLEPTLVILSCPTGTSEGHVDAISDDGGFSSIPVCFDDSSLDFFVCNDEVEVTEGEFETVQCFLEFPSVTP